MGSDIGGTPWLGIPTAELFATGRPVSTDRPFALEAGELGAGPGATEATDGTLDTVVTFLVAEVETGGFAGGVATMEVSGALLIGAGGVPTFFLTGSALEKEGTADVGVAATLAGDSEAFFLWEDL